MKQFDRLRTGPYRQTISVRSEILEINEFVSVADFHREEWKREAVNNWHCGSGGEWIGIQKR